MSASRLLKYVHLAYLAKPIADRAIFRTIRKIRAGNLVVIGLGDGQLAQKMVLFAQQDADRPHADRLHVQITGIDLFEMRSDRGGSLSLKQAYQLLHATGARTKLVPGDPFAALARSANVLLGTDLIVIRASQLGPAMDRAWFYVPRMMHDHSLVMVEQCGASGQTSSYEVLDRQAVQRLANTTAPMRRVA